MASSIATQAENPDDVISNREYMEVQGVKCLMINKEDYTVTIADVNG